MESLFRIRDFLADKGSKIPMKRKHEESVQDKIVVITGANSGIGEVTALKFAIRGAQVIMACRDMVKGTRVKEEIRQKAPEAFLELVELDLEDLTSIRKCAEEINARVTHINILINNAGLLYLDPDIRKSKEGMEIHMAVNHLGHFLLTNLLLDRLKKCTPSRVIIISSMNYKEAKLDLDDLMLEKSGPFGSNNSGAYSNSKLANMYFAKSLAERLTNTGINVYTVCPGLVQTNLSRNAPNWITKIMFMLSYGLAGLNCEEGAETILYCALSKKCAQETGQMYRFNKVWKNIMNSLCDDIAEKLWTKSAELVGIEN